MTYDTREFLEQWLIRNNYFATFDEMVKHDKHIPDYFESLTKGKIKVAWNGRIDLFELIGDAFEEYKKQIHEK